MVCRAEKVFIDGFLLNYQELRIEDYEAGRKTGATGATGATGSTGFPGLAASSAAGSLFGNTASTGFGAAQKPATGFGTTGL